MIKTSHDTLEVTQYAASKEALEKQVHFYTQLGFRAALQQDSVDDITLTTGEESNGSAQIRIVLAPELSLGSGDSDMVTSGGDWRSRGNYVSFEADEGIVERLKIANAEYHIVDDNEVYAVDPLGYTVAFTLNKTLNGVKSQGLSSAGTGSFYGGSESALNMTISETVYGTTSKDRGAAQRCIAVMTSGGDAPGMNANVRAIIRAALSFNCRAFAIKEGYSGLVKGNDMICEMSWNDVRGWLQPGGTHIGTARCSEFRERWGRLEACKNLVLAGIDGLIVCGGDGSLTGADLFRSEWPSLIDELLSKGQISKDQHQRHQHLNICGTVGSIDNDMATTDATIGAYSSLARICQAIDYIDATANSHQRAFVVEVMGRHCGWLALMAGIACSADYVFIPEKPSKRDEWHNHMCEIVSQHRSRGKRKTIVIVAEGAIGANLEPITSEDVKQVLVDKLGLDTRVTRLGHVQRGGDAVAYDRLLATLQGVAAVECILESQPSTPSPMIAISQEKIVRRVLKDAVALTKSVAEAISQKDFEKAISLRDSEFQEYLHYLVSMNSADFKEPKLEFGERKKFAIINVGAPAGGMNAATYAFTNYCLSQGHKPYAIHNGFTGLARHESVRSIDWLDIENYTSLGGSEIGTNRYTPQEAGIDKIAYYFAKYKFDGLVIVGGFEALKSLQELDEARVSYPSLRIPMVLIPATISNNVPGTEYSLGSDTCLNSLVTYCDTINQSASAVRNRCFVVECQGGNCGYLGACAQMCTGAMASYVPEEGLPLDLLGLDITMIKQNFNQYKDDKGGRLIIKSENASKVLTTEIIAKIMDDESEGIFDTRTAVPGHYQQGAIPSAIDRTRGVRFAIKAVNFLQEQFDNAKVGENEVGDFEHSDISRGTACVLGIEGGQVHFSKVKDIWKEESDEGKRMRKEIFWGKILQVADMMVGRKVHN